MRRRCFAMVTLALRVSLMLAVSAPAGAAEPAANVSACFGPASGEARIGGCTELIEAGVLGGTDLAMAHAHRALELALLGRLDAALSDFDRSLALEPNSATVLNNRAWVLYRLGDIETSTTDVEASLRLQANNPHAFDTRAHVRQASGKPDGALADYHRAMRLGGAEFVRTYQCGLKAQSLYKGDIDGVRSEALDTALEACVQKAGCDPLPPGETCEEATS